MRPANVARHSPDRKSHYNRPLVNRSPKTYLAYLVRGFEYLDAERMPSDLPDEELVPRLRETAPVVLRGLIGFPSEAFVEPYPLHTRFAIEALTALAHASIRKNRIEWTDRDRVVRVVTSTRFAHGLPGDAEVKNILNRGDREKNGLTRYSIQSVERTFRAALKDKRLGLRQVGADTTNVKALRYLEEQARDDRRFYNLKGEKLADAIEQHVGMAKAAERVRRILFDRLTGTGAQKTDD